jgi:poly(A) polymerase
MKREADHLLRNFVASRPELQTLTGLLSPGQECYLVGGAVRDLLLGRPVPDIDLAMPGDPSALAQRFAGVSGGRFFYLDQERGHSRVVSSSEQKTAFDFAPFRAVDLAGDLAARDFTLNALAWPLHRPLTEAALIDPLGGIADLNQKLLRCCSPSVLEDDPLRVLRGVRLAGRLGLSIEAATWHRMQAAAPGLYRIAGERILAELGKILAAEQASCGAEMLRDLGVLSILFGLTQGGIGAVALELNLLKRAEERFALLPQMWLNAEMEAWWSRAALVRFAALLRNCGVEEGDDALQRLPFSRDAWTMLSEMLAVPAGLARAYGSLTCSERGKALWLSNLGRFPLEQMIFSTLIPGEEDGTCRQSLAGAFSLWARYADEGKISPLIPAHELMERFGFPAGPEIGRLLNRLMQEEISGCVATREQALDWLRKRLERD